MSNKNTLQRLVKQIQIKLQEARSESIPHCDSLLKRNIIPSPQAMTQWQFYTPGAPSVGFLLYDEGVKVGRKSWDSDSQQHHGPAGGLT